LHRLGRAARSSVDPVPAWLLALDLLHRLVQVAAGPFPPFKDAVAYWRIGEGLVRAGTFLAGDPDGFRTPMYPTFLAFWQWVGGDWALQGAVAAQNLLGLSAALAIAKVAAAVSGSRKSGVLAYALSALCLGRIQYDQVLMAESLFVFLLAAHLLLLWRAVEGRSWRRSCVAGLVAGVAALTRPAGVLLAPVEAVVLLAAAPRAGRRGGFLVAAGLLVGLSLPVGAWVARNAAVFGSPALFRPLGITGWEHTFRKKGGGLDVPSPALELLGPEGNPRSGWEVSAGLRGTGLDAELARRWMDELAGEARRNQRGLYLTALAWNFAIFWWDVQEAHPFYLRPSGLEDPSLSDQRLLRSPKLASMGRPMLHLLYRYPPLAQAAFSALSLAAAIVLLRGTGRDRAFGALTLAWLLYFSAVTVLAMYPLFRFRMVLDPVAIVAITAATVRVAVALRARKGLPPLPAG